MAEPTFDNLTLGEIADVEDVTGESFAAMSDEAKPKTKILIAIAWVLKRRDEPTFTYDDARNLTMAELTELTGSSADPEAPSA